MNRRNHDVEEQQLAPSGYRNLYIKQTLTGGPETWTRFSAGTSPAATALNAGQPGAADDTSGRNGLESWRAGFSSVLACGCVGLLPPDPTTQHRAKQKIVKVVHQTVQTEQSGNLRPVTDFVQQNMHDNFSWCHRQNAIHQLVILRDVPLLGRKALDKFLQVFPALPTESEERLNVVVRDGGRVA